MCDAWLAQTPRQVRCSGQKHFRRAKPNQLEMPNSLGADVRWIPDRLQTLSEWLGANRTTVVAISAPAYFRGAAFVAYHELFQRGGFLQLEQDGTAWRATKESTWYE